MKKQKQKSNASKGCQKISNFFTKQNVDTNKYISNSKAEAAIEVINLNSDDSSESFVSEDDHRQSVATASETTQNKRKFVSGDDGDDFNNSPILKRRFRSKSKDKKKCLSKNSPTTRVDNKPSTHASVPSFLKVKESKDLLINSGSEIYSSPKKVMDRFLNRSNLTAGKSIKTPEKCCSTKNNSFSGEKTPKSAKKSPKTSPIDLSEFNTAVFDNFFISEPRSALKANDTTEKALLVQQQNERTPSKNETGAQTSTYISPRSKIKTKLDFSSCDNAKSRPRMTSEDELLADEEEVNKQNSEEKLTITALSLDDDDVDWSDSQLIFDEIFEYTLDLNQNQHCKIMNLNRQISSIILTVKSTNSGQQAICYVEGFWMHLNLSIGDVIRLEAKKANENWQIDNQQGYLILEPDYLISTTSVVNSVFCKRRAVFNEKFRGFDSTNKAMVVGSMVHVLLQEVLQKELQTFSDIEACAERIVNEKDWMKQIYETDEPFDVVKAEFYFYISEIEKFVNSYVKISSAKQFNLSSSKLPKGKNNWRGKITQIDDIEENIWCPQLGVKGKIDVNIINDKNQLMPLELKTGRASVSIEHRGQVMLYIMMMNKLGYNVNSGLLLYLKEGILKEIPASQAEKRDLLMLRNELAYFLTRPPPILKGSNENIQTTDAVTDPHSNIPETIDHPCCTQCPYNGICVAYSKFFNEDLSNRKTLNFLQNKFDTHITKTHIDYFMYWNAMLSIEMDHRYSQKKMKDIYTISPDERTRQGKCIIDLKILDIQQEINGTYNHIFEELTVKTNRNFLASGLIENDYVIISINGRPAIATGFITNISLQKITVSIDRNLRKKYPNNTFILDSYDSTAFLTYNLASLALILDTDNHANQLRQIIIDRHPTSFKSTLPKIIAERAKPIFKCLNEIQQRAVLKAVAAEKYFLIRGMPGTGKTATIVALIQLLVELNKTILITSHTHSAVDNVCLKLLKSGIKFMRLGNEERVDTNIREFSECNLTRNCRTPDELKKVYDNIQIFAVTCLGSSHSILSKRTLDVCIVDESTQVLQCSVFRPIYACHSFILVGDPDQLPAVVRSQKAIEMGMSESLFERLQINKSSMVTLNLNYRMNKCITELANLLTYNGELLIGSEQVEKATFQIPNCNKMQEAAKDYQWALKILSTSLDDSVQFVDTGPVWELNFTPNWIVIKNTDETYKYINIFEASIIFHLVQILLQGEINPSDIGIIATYKSQVTQIANILKSTNIEINTVDQFQGKDRSIVIYSCSKSKDLTNEWQENKQDLLEDNRRLNVAITRAKHKLIIIGDLNTLKNYSTFKKIYKKLNENVIRLARFSEFSWEKTIEAVTPV